MIGGFAAILSFALTSLRTVEELYRLHDTGILHPASRVHWPTVFVMAVKPDLLTAFQYQAASDVGRRSYATTPMLCWFKVGGVGWHPNSAIVISFLDFFSGHACLLLDMRLHDFSGCTLRFCLSSDLTRPMTLVVSYNRSTVLSFNPIS